MAEITPPDAAPQRVILRHLSVSFTPETAAVLAEEVPWAGMARATFVRWIVEEWLRGNR